MWCDVFAWVRSRQTPCASPVLRYFFQSFLSFAVSVRRCSTNLLSTFHASPRSRTFGVCFWQCVAYLNYVPLHNLRTQPQTDRGDAAIRPQVDHWSTWRRCSLSLSLTIGYSALLLLAVCPAAVWRYPANDHRFISPPCPVELLRLLIHHIEWHRFRSFYTFIWLLAMMTSH